MPRNFIDDDDFTAAIGLMDINELKEELYNIQERIDSIADNIEEYYASKKDRDAIIRAKTAKSHCIRQRAQIKEQIRVLQGKAHVEKLESGQLDDGYFRRSARDVLDSKTFETIEQIASEHKHKRIIELEKIKGG